MAKKTAKIKRTIPSAKSDKMQGGVGSLVGAGNVKGASRSALLEYIENDKGGAGDISSMGIPSASSQYVPDAALRQAIRNAPVYEPGLANITQQQNQRDGQRAAWEGNNIYDPTIGYGRANPGETGNDAVKRIKQTRKVKKAK